jgi:hypothetical protein
MASKSGIYKIGISHDPKKRLQAIKTAAPEPVRLLFAIGCPSESKAREFETKLHQVLAEYVSNGEWFKTDKGKVAVALFDVLVESEFFGEHHPGTPETTPKRVYPSDFERDRLLNGIQERIDNIQAVIDKPLSAVDELTIDTKKFHESFADQLSKVKSVSLDDYIAYCKRNGITEMGVPPGELYDKIVSRN